MTDWIPNQASPPARSRRARSRCSPAAELKAARRLAGANASASGPDGKSRCEGFSAQCFRQNGSSRPGLSRIWGSARSILFLLAYFSRQLHMSTPRIGFIFSATQLLELGALLAAPIALRRFGIVPGISLMQAGVALSLALLATGPAGNHGGNYLRDVRLVPVHERARYLHAAHVARGTGPARRRFVAEFLRHRGVTGRRLGAGWPVYRPVRLSSVADNRGGHSSVSRVAVPSSAGRTIRLAVTGRVIRS